MSASINPVALEDKHFKAQYDLSGGKPILIAITILGVLGIGVCVAVCGQYHGWWQLPGLDKLSGVNCIVVSCVGGVVGFSSFFAGIGGMIGHCKRSGLTFVSPKEKITSQLGNKHFTYALQKNGNYALIAKRHDGSTQILEKDLDPALFQEYEINVTDRVSEIVRDIDRLPANAGLSSYTYVKTDEPS